MRLPRPAAAAVSGALSPRPCSSWTDERKRLMGAIINNFREQLSARCGDALACRNPPRQTARPPQGWRGHHRNLLLRNVEYPASRLAGIMEVGPKASASAS